MTSSRSDTACAVSIEVDARQAYIFETDKLREMLGASRIIDGTRAQARDELDPGDGLYLVSPVSGEIRAWSRASERQVLLAAVWRIREWLNERGVEHTIAWCEGIDIRHLEEDAGSYAGADLKAEIHGRLAARVRALKAGKSGGDARPTCSLFAPCHIHALDPADHWAPGDEDSRRRLMGFRASTKLRAWEAERREFYRSLLDKPVRARFMKHKLAVDPRRAITYSDISEMESGPDSGDQYIAFICGDGDRMGQMLLSLSWNSTDWTAGPFAKEPPWRRNAKLVDALQGAAQDALGEAIADISPAPRADQPFTVPVMVLPQLAGGDDVWVVASRARALQLASAFGKGYAARLADPAHHDGIVRDAKSIAGEQQNLTMSFGIAFAKAGHPVHAMVAAAEQLLKSAKALRKGTASGIGRPADPDGRNEGCIDWHWIDSSLAEDVSDARLQLSYDDDGTVMWLTTRPWTITETEAFVKATDCLRKLPRRKLEQLETIVRLGWDLSLLAWEGWWKGLRKGEQAVLAEVNSALPNAFQVNLSGTESGPWCNVGTHESPRWTTPWLDLLVLFDVTESSEAVP